MKILLITGSYPPMKCGVGDYARHLVSALRRQPGMAIAVLTDAGAKGSAHEADTDGFFPLLDPAGYGAKASAQAVSQVIRDWRPDLVHIQFPTMGYVTWKRVPFLLPYLARRAGVPVIATWHEAFVFWGFGHSVLPLNWLNMLLLSGLIFVRPRYFDLMPRWFRTLMRFKRWRVIENASTIPVKHPDATERARLRQKMGAEGRRLIAFFGFAYANKKIEQIFEIADPARDHIVLVCDLSPDMPYQSNLLRLAQSEAWKGKVTVTGFLPADDVGMILASADAVILPFELGGGVWNTSIHAVKSQGVFLVTTSREKLGYCADENVYYSRPLDVADMREGLARHIGTRREAAPVNRWDAIAAEHAAFYKACL